jgi:ubiquitin-conjugating enzyme E2 variant
LSSLTANGRYGYSRSHRLLEVTGIAGFLGLMIYLSTRIAWSTTEARGPSWWWLAACALGGLLLCDFISGMVHWAGDTIGGEGMLLFGPHFIKPFREHHTDPKAITRHDFIQTNGNNCLISLPVIGALAPSMSYETTPGFYISTVVVFASWFGFWTNQFHKWAHADRPPRLALWLQRWSLILRPTHHDIHHASPHDKYYCITVGWMNPLLSWLRFFRALEWAVAVFRPSLLHLGERSAAVATARSRTAPG